MLTIWIEFVVLNVIMVCPYPCKTELQTEDVSISDVFILMYELDFIYVYVQVTI